LPVVVVFPALPVIFIAVWVFEPFFVALNLIFLSGAFRDMFELFKTFYISFFAVWAMI
jgi:hypothetical protein